jgi:predicted XRE-type DNA-binding protein
LLPPVGALWVVIYAWRKRYGDLEVNDVRRLKQLEQENARLKKLVAERDLEIEVMKEVSRRKVVTAPMRRRQVAYGMRRGLSQRRACSLFSVARSALSYRSELAVKDAPALTAMRRLAREYPRFGYRRIAILLRREGFPHQQISNMPTSACRAQQHEETTGSGLAQNENSLSRIKAFTVSRLTPSASIA